MNKTILSSIGMFVAGAAIGSLVTWKLVKTKYEQIAQEEIDSVKEAFSKRGDKSSDKEDEGIEEADSEKKTFEGIIDESCYKTESTDKGEKKEMNNSDRPYVITPEEFGDSDYAIISLTYYTDGTVTNEKNKIVANVDELVGLDSLNHFGEYEDDSVFVRNDALQIDFEILKDWRDYSEVM